MLFASYCRSIVFWSSVYRMSLIFFWRMISSRCLQSSLLLITAPNIKSSHISSSSSLLYFLVICFSISCVGRRILLLYIRETWFRRDVLPAIIDCSFQSNERNTAPINKSKTDFYTKNGVFLLLLYTASSCVSTGF